MVKTKSIKVYIALFTLGEASEALPLLSSQLVRRVETNVTQSERLNGGSPGLRCTNFTAPASLQPTSSHASPKTSSVLCIVYFYLQLLFLVSLFLLCVLSRLRLSLDELWCCCEGGGDTFHTWPVLYFENSFFFPLMTLFQSFGLKMYWWSGEHKTVVSLFFFSVLNMRMIIYLKLYSQTWFIAFLESNIFCWVLKDDVHVLYFVFGYIGFFFHVEYINK